MRPTPLAVVAFTAGGSLAVLTAAWDPDLWPWWLAYCALFVVILGADALLGPRLGRLQVKLTAPKRLRVGATQQADLIIERPSAWPLTVRIKVDTSADLDQVPEQSGQRLVRGQNRLSIPLTPKRRGQVTVQALWLAARGPLGLTEFRRRVSLDLRRPVHPNLKAVSRDAVKLFTTRNLQSGVRIERHRGDGTEFDHLREYVPGFDIRTIDWKASARNAKLLVREYRAERNRQVMVAIDSGRLMSEPLLGVPRLDHAIHAGLVLSYVSLKVGDRVGLVSFDDKLRHHVMPVRGASAFAELSNVASRIDYSSRETNFTLGLLELARRQVRRALVVVMTDFVDTIAAELMVENLSRLSRQHKVLFVALQDPLLSDEAGRRPGDALALHRSVVAHNLLADRDMVIQRLRRLGILCVDAAPGQVTAKLLDRYLDVKRREAF